MKNKTFMTWVITGMICLCFLWVIDSYTHVGSAQGTLYWGSSGENVKKVQTKLKSWKYYDGAIDGIYGSATFQAVKKFQRKNGLTADGVVGARTAEKLGLPYKKSKQANYRSSGKTDVRNDDVSLLAKAITGESRGEPYIGKVAVGAVILNRTRHPSFPNTIAGVVYQPGAFTAVSDGQINLAPDPSCVKAARDALNGWDPSGGCIYYWNPATATSKWIWSREVVKKIGDHWFGN